MTLRARSLSWGLLAVLREYPYLLYRLSTDDLMRAQFYDVDSVAPGARK